MFTCIYTSLKGLRHRRIDIACGLVGITVLSACTLVTATQSQQIATALTQLSNTQMNDLQLQAKVALAATPPDLHGAQCAGTLPDPTATPPVPGTGALAVGAAIQQVVAVTAGQPVGAFTTAEIASLYQPGSQQYEWALNTIGSACINKFHDVFASGVATEATIVASLGTILALAPAK